MFGRIIGVIIGFIVACLAAGLTKSFFATTPSELAALPADVAADRMSRALEIGLFAAAQSAIFSAPFALVAAAIGEWRRIRAWTYYALVGVAIAVVGFLAQYSSEVPGQPTIVNNYALTAFVTAGFIGGLVYWLITGRSAGGNPRVVAPPPAVKPASEAARTADKPKSSGTVPNAGTPKKA